MKRFLCVPALVVVVSLSVLSALHAQPKSIKSARDYAVGTWTGSNSAGDLAIWTKCVLNVNGSVVAYAQPATADGWGSPTWSGTWKAGTDKHADAGDTYFYIEFTVEKSEILDVGKKIRLAYVKNDLVGTVIHLHKGDKNPFKRTPTK